MSLYRFLLGICSFLIHLFFRIEIIGNTRLPKGKPCIIAANHISYLDPIVIAMAFSQENIHFLGKKELFQKAFFNRLFTKLGVIPVDRNKNDVTAVKNVLRLLRKNQILGIFPQGTRVKSEEEDRSKAGLGMFAVKSGADVIPVTITSTYRLFSKIQLRIHQIYQVDTDGAHNTSQKYMEIAEEVMSIIKG